MVKFVFSTEQKHSMDSFVVTLDMPECCVSVHVVDVGDVEGDEGRVVSHTHHGISGHRS